MKQTLNLKSDKYTWTLNLTAAMCTRMRACIGGLCIYFQCSCIPTNACVCWINKRNKLKCNACLLLGLSYTQRVHMHFQMHDLAKICRHQFENAYVCVASWKVHVYFKIAFSVISLKLIVNICMNRNSRGAKRQSARREYAKA